MCEQLAEAVAASVIVVEPERGPLSRWVLRPSKGKTTTVEPRWSPCG